MIIVKHITIITFNSTVYLVPCTMKRMANTVLLILLWQEFMTRLITKAMPISYIDSKCYIKAVGLV